MTKDWIHVRRYIYIIDNLVILCCGFYHFQNIFSLLQNVINISSDVICYDHRLTIRQFVMLSLETEIKYNLLEGKIQLSIV